NITSIPAALKFVFALFSSLSFVGAFYLYRSDINFKWIWLGAAFIPTMLSAAQSTTFHEMFLWGGFIIIIYTYVNKSKPLVKFGLVSASIAVVLLISSVKAQFREQVSEGNITDKAGSTMVLVETINEEVNDDNKKPIPEEEDFMQTFVDRINQGWIIARVMYVVPEYEPFAKGETIEDGIYAALLPRILAPNKQVAGGATNFERFTGLKLVNTSMNLSIVGEAYGNYGEQGGIIFMFIYGFFFNAILHIIRTKAITTQEYLLWIPFMFLYTVKAEDDFGMSLNYFTKSAIVMVLFVWLSNRYMKVLTAG
ncbi:MAG: hypothetical protein IT235_04655, partial [Bacteroidia bacterium]|nr:hypothetical protein [Bacteroidia bacterium]